MPEGAANIKKERNRKKEVKDRYRKFFLSIREFINLSTAYKKIGIQQANFSRFLNGAYSAMSIDNLERIRRYCEDMIREVQKASEEYEKASEEQTAEEPSVNQ